MEGLTILHEKKVGGRNVHLSDIAGKLRMTSDGKYNLYCSFSPNIAAFFTDKTKGFMLASKGDDLFLVYTDNGYVLTDNGRNSIRRSFTAVLYDNTSSKKLLRLHAGKNFEGKMIDKTTIKINFS